MTESTRRGFLKNSALAAASTAITAPVIAKSRAGANERIRIGLLGLGGRMRSHVAALVELESEANVEIVAACDCDQKKLDNVAGQYPQLAGRSLKHFSDMREMFEDSSIDAVTNALGDRWHALSTIWACQAGKDSYVEKPGSHNLFESRRMVAAARKYQRMVQHGTQNRSSPNIREGIEKLHEGVIGHVYMARAIDYKIRGNLGRITPSPVPEGLDWDRWLGPKPTREYSQFWHRRWYWNLELSSGCFANQMIHEMDILRWGLQLERHPTRVMAAGGKFVHDDDRTSPTHAAITYQFGGQEPLVTCEHRSWYTNSEADFRDKFPFVQPGYPVGTIFFGSEGYLIFPDYSSYYTFLGPKYEPGPSRAEQGHPMADAPHFRNWIAAMRSRKHEDLNADIEQGHRSMTMSLLARTAWQVGRCLQFDPDAETVVGDDQADTMLNAPQYREPYVVPAEV